MESNGNLIPESVVTEEKKEEILSQEILHLPTPEKSRKLRGVGYTRKDKTLSKVKMRIQKESVKKNRNKKRHHMTKKEKKSR